MVKVWVPVVALLLTVTVSVDVPDPVTEVGLKVAVTLPGTPDTLRGCDFLDFCEKPVLKTKHLRAKNSLVFKKVTSSQVDCSCKSVLAGDGDRVD